MTVLDKLLCYGCCVMPVGAGLFLLAFGGLTWLIWKTFTGDDVAAKQ